MTEEKPIEKIKYKRQFYPGTEKVSERRRKIMNPERRLVKLRDIPDDDIILLLGHRAPDVAGKDAVFAQLV